jgi:hypothetical protein
MMTRARRGTAPLDIEEPPAADVGLGADWMFAQRDATIDAAREATTQARLKISYRLTPVFIPPATPIQSAFSGMNAPPNVPKPPLARS